MKHSHNGMTLIELLTTVAVVAILSAIAVNSYSNYSLRANRSEGRSAIMRIQAAEEKYFLQNNTYTTDFTDAPPTGLGQGSATTANGYYTITVTANTGGTIATSYLVTATAAAGQVRDAAACQTFSIDDQGNKLPVDSTGCWR